MRKRFLSMLLLLGMLLSLTGCECNHQWSEADCVNASACDKCGEIQGEALGHEWGEADCLNPETCSRCGETRGAALGHNFGDWLAADTYMSRSCNICGTEEQAPINRKTLLESYIIGSWNHYIELPQDSMGLVMLSSYDYPTDAIPGYAYFSEDGSGFITYSAYDENLEIYIEDINFNWEFADYFADENLYAVSLTTDEGTSTATISFDVDSKLLLEIHLADSICIFTQNPEVEEFLLGVWTCEDNDGNILSFELFEDGRMSGNIKGPVSGRWYAKPVGTDKYGYIIGLSLRYEQDGQDKVRYGEVSFHSFEPDYKTLLETHHNDVSMILKNKGGHIGAFERKTPEMVERQRQLVADASTLLVGDWQSSLVFSGEERQYNTDCVVSFMDDGSFTAHLAEDITGTWTVSEADVRYAISYIYLNLIHDSSLSISANVSIEDQKSPMLCFYTYSGELEASTDTSSYMFSKMDDIEAESPETVALQQQLADDALDMIVGKWQSVGSFVNGKQDDSNEYTINFTKDGGFKAHLAEDISGTWEFQSCDVQGGISFVFFKLTQGSYGSIEANISLDSINPPILTIAIYSNGTEAFYAFCK